MSEAQLQRALEKAYREISRLKAELKDLRQAIANAGL